MTEKGNPDLQGVITPMVTPLLGRNALDVDGLERLLEHIMDGGVNGAFILGTTGEGPSLSYALRHDMIEQTCRIVSGRVPVWVGITDTAFEESLNVARKAALAGAKYVVLAPPYYATMVQSEFLGYLRRLVEELPLPVILYNNPGATRHLFEPETVRRIADSSKVVGLKDTSSNMGYFHEVRRLLRDRPEFAFFVGPEVLLAESVLMGGDGGVNGGSNIYPGLLVEIYNAARAGEINRLRSLQERLLELREALLKIGSCKSRYIKGLKCALYLMGICNDAMAEPFEAFGDDVKRLMTERLEQFGLLGSA